MLLVRVGLLLALREFGIYVPYGNKRRLIGPEQDMFMLNVGTFVIENK
jgi:hypothetical protein